MVSSLDFAQKRLKFLVEQFISSVGTHNTQQTSRQFSVRIPSLSVYTHGNTCIVCLQGSGQKSYSRHLIVACPPQSSPLNTATLRRGSGHSQQAENVLGNVHFHVEPPTNTNILLGGGDQCSSDTGPISFYHCRFHAHGPDLRRSVVMPVFVDILLDLAQQLTNQGRG